MTNEKRIRGKRKEIDDVTEVLGNKNRRRGKSRRFRNFCWWFGARKYCKRDRESRTSEDFRDDILSSTEDTKRAIPWNVHLIYFKYCNIYIPILSKIQVWNEFHFSKNNFVPAAISQAKVRNIQLQRFIARLNRASFHFYEEHRAQKVWERVSRRTYKLYI